MQEALLADSIGPALPVLALTGGDTCPAAGAARHNERRAARPQRLSAVAIVRIDLLADRARLGRLDLVILSG